MTDKVLGGKDDTLELLMGLGILYHGVAQVDDAEPASFPLLPSLLTLTASEGITVARMHSVMAKAFAQGRELQGVVGEV